MSSKQQVPTLATGRPGFPTCDWRPGFCGFAATSHGATAVGRPIVCNIIEYPDSYPADEPSRRCPDIRKARLQLGYAAQVKLDEGLRRFLDWSQQAYVGES